MKPSRFPDEAYYRGLEDDEPPDNRLYLALFGLLLAGIFFFVAVLAFTLETALTNQGESPHDERPAIRAIAP